MKNQILILLFSMAPFASGCSTIYFHNASARTIPDYSEWHHDGIFGFVQFSDATDMSQRCESKKWNTIKIEETFVQGLVRAVTYSLYDPWNISYSCHQ